MRDLLAVHRDLLERRRGVMNLVGPGPLEPHYEDSVAAVGWLAPEGRWVDLGTGAGFPGIVFAARFPHVALDLVDSRRKRCTFLEAVLLAAGATDRAAPLRVLCQRAEDLPDGAYDGVMARAFAPPDEVLAHAARLLRPGGTVVLFLQADAALPEARGFERRHVEPYTVDGKPRKAVAYTRT